MSESVVADFTGKFVVDGTRHSEPHTGRIVLSGKRLVLVGSDDRVTIPLSTVFDVGVGEVPQAVSQFFDDTVTIGFRRNGEVHTAAVEADSKAIERFGTLLYKARLNGATVALRHPARVGGRVTDAGIQRAQLSIEPERLVCEGDPTVEIDLSGVVHFEKLRRTIDDTTRPVLAVRHASDGQMMTTELGLASEDRMNVLGRFLRRRYREIMQDVRELSLADDEKRVLVGVYSGGAGADLARVLDLEPSQVSMVLNDLEEKGLVGSDGTLTPRGQVVVSEHIEDVNV